MVYSHPWSFNSHINISHYLALRAEAECMAYDQCVERETQKPTLVTLVSTPDGLELSPAQEWMDFAKAQYHEPVTAVRVIQQWQELAWEVRVFRAVQECHRYQSCLVAESSTIQDTYTYHADLEEPARTWW